MAAPTPRPLKRRGGKAKASVAKPGRISGIFAFPALLVSLVFTLGPIAVIAAFSFMTQPEKGGGVVFAFSTAGWKQFLFSEDFFGNVSFDSRYLQVFGTGLWQALLTTVVCIALAFPIAVWMAMKSEKTQRTLLLFIMIPFWTNLLVRTYAWILMFNENGSVNTVLEAIGIGKKTLLYTPFASAVGLIYTFLPYAILPLYSAVAGFDFRLVEAAYDLGATKGVVIRRILWPSVSGGVLSAIALLFVPAFGSYIQPVLLGGGKVLMPGNLIASQYAEARNWPFGSVLSLIVLLLTLLGAGLVTVWAKRSSQKVSLSI
jgi:spermidine/putrescine transport system permease protein